MTVGVKPKTKETTVLFCIYFYSSFLRQWHFLLILGWLYKRFIKGKEAQKPESPPGIESGTIEYKAVTQANTPHGEAPTMMGIGETQGL